MKSCWFECSWLVVNDTENHHTGAMHPCTTSTLSVTHSVYHTRYTTLSLPHSVYHTRCTTRSVAHWCYAPCTVLTLLCSSRSAGDTDKSAQNLSKSTKDGYGYGDMHNVHLCPVVSLQAVFLLLILFVSSVSSLHSPTMLAMCYHMLATRWSCWWCLVVVISGYMCTRWLLRPVVQLQFAHHACNST